jgi:DNA transformation protein
MLNGLTGSFKSQRMNSIQNGDKNDMSTENLIKGLAKQLRNVGPKLAKKLAEAGIDSPEKLRQLGAKKAFERIYASGDAYGDFNAAYLYALEGAIRDCDWLKIPDETKQEYKEYAQRLQVQKNARAKQTL